MVINGTFDVITKFEFIDILSVSTEMLLEVEHLHIHEATLYIYLIIIILHHYLFIPSPMDDTRRPDFPRFLKIKTIIITILRASKISSFFEMLLQS